MESVTEGIEFFIGLIVILAIVAVILIFETSNVASYNISNYKEAFVQNIKLYISNNTLYIVNKGSSLGSTVFYFNLYFTNNTNKAYTLHLPIIGTGTTIYSIPYNTTIKSASLQIYGQSGGYLISEELLNTQFFTISNIYSSSYVFINGKESNPIIENFSTYYYNVSAPIIHLLLYSPYYYYNTTLYNTRNFNLPTRIITYYIEPELVNGTKITPIINSSNYDQNKIQINSKFEIYPKNTIINFSYSGSQININYCYYNICNNPEYSNYSGIFNMSEYSTTSTSPTLIYIYKNSDATFYLSTEQYNLTASASKLTELLSVPGDLVLTSTTFTGLNYSFKVSSSGITKWIRNGNYNFIYTTFNDQIVKGKVDITNSGVYILGAKTFSLTFTSNYNGIPFSIDGHTFNTSVALELLNNTEYYYNFTEIKQNSTEKLAFESQNVCGKTIYTNQYKYFVNQSTTPCTISATYNLYPNLTLKAYNGTIEAINSTGSTVLISNGSTYLPLNSQIKLKPIPNSGYVFYKYQSNSISGYSGTNPNPTIIMSNSIIEYGYFVPYETITYTETNGTINTNTSYCLQANATNPTISCNVPKNTKISLTYTPNTNYQFVNWTGTYNNNTSTIISFVANKTITETANSKPIFELLRYTETNGTITSNINSCKEANSTYPTITCNVIKGTNIVLTYTPNSNYGFINWSGTYNSTKNPLSFTIDQNTNEIVNSREIFTLTYTETNGSITTNISGCKEANAINPTITCNVIEGKDVSLSYIPNNNYLFTNWTGTQNSLSNPLTFIMNQKTVETANSKPKITYLYMSIQNTQSSSTPAPFQQEIIFDANNYSKYESSNLGNIRIFNSANQQMNFWCESGCSNTSTKTVIIMKIPNGIPAGTTQQYKVEFLNKTTTYNGTTAGEAPELSSSYGEYDNGANVFNFYNNFAGTSLSGKWVNQYNNGYFSVNNGLTVNPNPDVTSTASPQIYSNYQITTPQILGFYGEANLASKTGANNIAYFGDVNSSNDNAQDMALGSEGYSGSSHVGLVGYTSSGNPVSATSSSLGMPDTSSTLYTIIIPNSNTAIGYSNGVSSINDSYSNGGLNIIGSNSRIGFVSQSNGQTIGPIYYVYSMSYPPDGTMPTVTFGTVQ